MSFGGFGGFGQQNNTSNTGGFGGFGSTAANNTTPAFGQQSSTPAFGSTNANTGGGLFGGSSGGGFGSNTGGAFGATPNNAFGAKPAFGAPATTSSGGGLFGSTTATTGGAFGTGGFGTNNTSATGFGGNSGNTMFGANKPAFGATNSATAGTGSLFGNNSTPFGGTGTAFGSTTASTLGGAVPDPPGTAVAPFQPYLEKEGTSSAQNSFQNILFQEPYKKYSVEELRLVDYAQGRQYGNGPSGAAGAFGTTSGFGNTGFGNATSNTGFGTNNTTGGGLFGNNNTQQTSTGFGSTGNTNTGGGFGGGLFGNQNKPATGGLFGNTATSQPAQTGGLFSTNTGGGFGNAATSNAFGTTAATNTGGGLFGNQNQNKTAGTGFGSSFGSNTAGAFGNTGTNAFGTTANNTGTGGGLFGNQTQNPSTGTGLFGTGNTQQQSQTGGFPSTFGTQNQQQTGGLFGNQPKPAGNLFGGNTTAQPTTGTGGLFGQSTTSASFGQPNNQTQQQGTGLFGQKPAATGGGLFGNTQQQTGQTGGLFGGLATNNQTQQQPATGSLFGGQTQQKPSLFGTPAQSTGTGLFGQPAQQQQSTLFGGTAAQQPQQNSLLGSTLFNSSQNAQSTPQSLTASISDVNAFGTPSLFAGLGTTEVQNPGPLATPLSSKNKGPRKNTILPMWKLNPGSGSKFVTPVKRGFGFSYSTYGSPVTPSSTGSTPGTFGQSLLGAGQLNRSLSKSFSSSNLRRSINAEDSILSPGSFSASMGPRSYGSGRLNKLTVDKSLRVDLFSPISKEKAAESPNGPRKLPKRVSFDTSNVEPGNGTPSTIGSNGSSTGSTPDLGYIRAAPNGNASNVNGTASRSPDGPPEMEQVRGNELAVVPEEQSPSANSTAATVGAPGKEAGKYWMSPSKEELQKMNRVQLSQVSDFTVGRDNVGHVKFLVPVDLTNIDLDKIAGEIVVLETRSCTVYPDNVKKAAVGKGLNVPSEISLLFSWPRNMDKKTGLPIKNGRHLDKHIRKLQSTNDTNFVSYDPENGNWTFTVEHFTTYGLDYDEDDTDGETLGDITVDDVPLPSPPKPSKEIDDGSPSDDPEDTFEFRRKRRALPGAFDYTGAVSEDEEETADVQQQSFLSNRSVGSSFQAPVLDEDEEMNVGHALPEDQAASAYLGYHHAAEPEFDSPYHGGSMAEYQETPGGIMRARLQAIKGANTPLRIQVADGDDWADMLQKTINPQKRDRAALKSINEEATYEALKESIRKEDSPAKTKTVPDGRGFATSIELMNSLFEKPKAESRPAAPAPIPTSGFKWQYKRQDNTDQEEMKPNDRAFHDTFRPSWGPDGTLVLATAPKVLSRSSRRALEKDGIISMSHLNIVSENRDVRFAKFANESSAKALTNQISLTSVNIVNNVPTVGLGSVDSLTAFFHGQDLQNPANAHEKMVWELASILFDQVFDAHGRPIAAASELRQARRRNLSKFWQGLVEEAANRDVGMAHTPEDKAIAALSGHRVPDACKHLLDGKNFRLATLVSLIGTNDQLMQDMREQVREWRESNVLSEFSDPLRAIYELLGGNVCVVDGKKGVMENRMDSFVISDKFGMDWKQSFGLRLWYAITTNDDVVEAIHAFEEDLKQDKEKSPKPWYAEQGIQALWEDPDLEKREDLLWGLFKLYANEGIDLAGVLRPENSQLSPLDFRLCWQLGQALGNTGRMSFGGDSSDKADAATVSFASQLTSEGNWLEAIFVLLHLNKPAARVKAIQEHLARHAHLIGSETSEEFVTLTQTFKVPTTWIWQAKALFQRAVKKDAKAEVLFLLRAASYGEAHKTFVKQVAPLAIIERDYEGLWEMLAQFSSAEGSIADWNLGGKIYTDFLTVMQHVQRGNPSEVPQGAVKSLMAGLPAMQESVQVRADADVYEVAAVADMANVLAKVVVELSKTKQAQFSKVLSLPLTEDAYLKYSNELAFKYYQDVMAGGGS